MSSVTISGDTSGSIILQAPSVAGSTTLTLPTTSGTIITTGGGAAGSFTTLTSTQGASFATSSGNVGVGTSSPSVKLEVNGGINSTHLVLTGTASRGLKISTSNPNGQNDGTVIYNAQDPENLGQHIWQIGGTERMRIDSNGNISAMGIYNTTTAGAVNVNVRNDGYLLRSTSALKYKTDVRDLPSIDINKFRPVVYKSKCEGDDQTIDHFGIIADEVEAAGIKELVSYNAEGEIEGFQYERLTAVLVKAIQEQQTIIETLKAELDELKAKIG